MIRKILKTVIGLLILVIVLAAAFTAFLTVTDYRPEALTPLTITNCDQELKKAGFDKTFSITTFNIGYCGLDRNQDFFMDGGTMSRSSNKAKTQNNLEKVCSFLSKVDSDVILLQETDTKAFRSYGIDEYEYMKINFKDYDSTFGFNYKVPWVPVPVTKPMGYVYSGLASFTRIAPASAARYQYPGSEKWPVQLFELDRCFVENRLDVGGGMELVLINSHLSAFDKGGEIRRKQLAFLKTYITGEYAKGNYVIVGGDWNHVLPGTDPKLFKTTEAWPFWLQNLPADFTPEGFQWGVDRNIPSNRTVAAAYKEGVNFTSVIDGFLVSPNVEIKSVTGHDLGFENSDHNPVTGVFKLKPLLF